jgi:hypothetical protein
MRFLFLLLVAISASAGCNPRLLYSTYSTGDYIVTARLDDGALYVSLLLADDIERVDLSTGSRTIVSMHGGADWDVQHGFLATPEAIGRPTATHITVRDGYVYWLEGDAVLRRMIVGGRTVDTIAEQVSQYMIFENRVVFISDGKIFWKHLTLLLPPFFLTDGDAIDSVAPDAILVTRYIAGPGFFDIRADVLRVSWTGEAESIYEAASMTYHNVFSVTAIAAGPTVYIVKTNSYQNSLIVIRNGVAQERERVTGVIDVLDASENAITFAEWGSRITGLHEVVELCAVRPRSRVVR